ncbi:hypothetical protein L6164_004371 [Bauhinia variegata]|uniref:Uncharacterized protein n=1 Tax=Bauhinia variegata TaxID=167791 RepID=A0ACB9Q3Q1_BAUVA|nr:hypothetical protein L6164_004371 [Bauhinia variegata]
MATFLHQNPTFLKPHPSLPTRPSTPSSYFPIRCGSGPRSQRGPLVKGRILSIEAIQAVQSLKRLQRTNPTDLPQLISNTLSRLIKSDLLAALKELLRQDQCSLALQAFSVFRLEYKPDLSLYAEMVQALARSGMAEDVDRVILDMEGIDCEDKGLINLIKAVIGANRRESTVRIYGLMKEGGWGSTVEPDEYVVKVLSKGFKSFGEQDLAEEAESEYERAFTRQFPKTQNGLKLNRGKLEHPHPSLSNPIMHRERQATSSSSSTAAMNSGGLPPSPNAWLDTSHKLLPHWESFSLSHQSSIPISISRVNQVDAARLDVEMSAMLKEQLVKVFSLMKPGMLFQYEAELDAFLEFLIWRFSIWVDKPTPGIALMNLRYRNERAMESREKVRTGPEGPGLSVAQKIWYCVATVGGQYIWARLQSFSAFRRWGDSLQRSLARRAWILIQRIEGIYRAASFGNLLIFLCTGSYRNLIERALRARLVYGSPNMNRSVSFEYMNRQLVWNEFSEMLLLLLPLLNSSSVRNLLGPFSKDKSSSSGRDEGACPICQATPTIPFVALPCEHRYCYYCLRTRCAAVPSFRCSRCGEAVVAMQRCHQGMTFTRVE